MKKQEKQEKQVVVKSADRVLDIFELFAEEKEPMSLMDISRKLDMPTSSTYKLLQNLQARGYLETDKHEKMFFLGHKLFEIGSRYVQNTSLSAEFHHIAQRIVHSINESVFLSIRDGGNILYIAEKQSSHAVRFVSHLGMKLPLHATAMGKMFLSSLDQGEIRKLYPDEELGTLTANTVHSYQELLNQLEEIRKVGLAFSNGEAVEGVYCVAGPIYNSSKQLTASLGISIPSARIGDELWEQAVEAVRQACEELSMKLYFKQ
ncbi:IclR family transcriptional regulator [Paenibacillus sp. J2TS4]|uniref:IclR family transcriptional regulator n=1 Tax=Paenibacillus sp. J2TS4 TaxID=2807194 RepID=UPI001B1A5FDC|nr:IclR family transcriptional regulator [Paenibacillus sp. J2TS4]GIP34999.1 IclR family transcriptional regulator [Paenibacillus sp. J2TS4]